MNYKIAVITPTKGPDGLTNTVFDGFMQLKKEHPDLEVYASSRVFKPLNLELVLPKDDFVRFARGADLVCFMWGKREIDFGLAQKIDRWDKTVFIDGSEVGMNARFDFMLQDDILAGRYAGCGAVNQEMQRVCPLYFRREKPYLNGIIPLPNAIESPYTKYYDPAIKKDIDFVCIFGQDEYPIMRRYARELLIKYCIKNNFSYATDKTNGSDEFYKLLARAKVGVSVGGGGYDTGRFWEILGNNCLLLTERIDIFHPDSDELAYQRVYQFNNLYDFQYQLEKVGRFLVDGYREADLIDEYRRIISTHSSKARATKILEEAKLKGLI